MPVTKANLSVRIIGVPPGEAPLWVREKWVGLELPLTRYPAPRDYFTFGVLSQPAECLAQLWAVARGRARRVAGFAVKAHAPSRCLSDRARRPRRGGASTRLNTSRRSIISCFTKTSARRSAQAKRQLL
jgi:hypothetical protein